MIKKILLILGVVLMSFLSACSDHEDEIEKNKKDKDEHVALEVDCKEKEIELAVGEKMEIKILSGNGEYEVVVSPFDDGLEAILENGKIFISVNKSGEYALTLIDVQSTEKIIFKISARDEYVPLQVDYKNHEIELEIGESMEIAILAGNGEYEVNTSSSDNGIVVSLVNEKISVRANKMGEYVLNLADKKSNEKIDFVVYVIEKKQEEDTNIQSIFAKGVTEEHGWYDIDKLKRPQDLMACWLITASNMLQWWQDRYIETGKTLPEGTPNGTGDGMYKSAIFDIAINQFSDLEKGGDILDGILWYKEGKTKGISNHASPNPNTGGYLKNLDATEFECSEEYFVSYDSWEKKLTDEEVLEVFSQALLEKLGKGYVIGMDIKTQVGMGGSLHAITVWGAKVNAQNRVVGLYITDSDDYKQQLMYCPIDVYYYDGFWQSREVEIKIPIGDAYPEGGNWSVMRLYYIVTPC